MDGSRSRRVTIVDSPTAKTERDFHDRSLSRSLAVTGEEIGSHMLTMSEFEYSIADKADKLNLLLENNRMIENDLSMKVEQLDDQREYLENSRSAFENRTAQTNLVLERNIESLETILERLNHESAMLIKKSNHILSSINSLNLKMSDYNELGARIDNQAASLKGLSSTVTYLTTVHDIHDLVLEVDSMKEKIANIETEIFQKRRSISALKSRPKPVLKKPRKDVILAYAGTVRHIDDMKYRMKKIRKEKAAVKNLIRKVEKELFAKQKQRTSLQNEIKLIEDQPTYTHHPDYQHMLHKREHSHDRMVRMRDQLMRIIQNENDLRQAISSLEMKSREEDKCSELLDNLAVKIEARFECQRISEKQLTASELPYILLLESIERKISLAKTFSPSLPIHTPPVSLSPEHFTEAISVESTLSELTSKLERVLASNNHLIQRCNDLRSSNKNAKQQIKQVQKQINGYKKYTEMEMIVHNDNVDMIYKHKDAQTLPQDLAKLRSLIAKKKQIIEEKRRRIAGRAEKVSLIVKQYGTETKHAAVFDDSTTL